MPLEWTDNWPYEPPQSYWGLVVPVYFCTALFLFAFCIYPAMHSQYDSELNDTSVVTDVFAHPPNHFKRLKEAKKTPRKKNTERSAMYSKSKPISPVSDLDLNDVSQVLYLEK